MNTTGSLSKHEKAKEGSSLKDLVIEIQLKGGSGVNIIFSIIYLTIYA